MGWVNISAYTLANQQREVNVGLQTASIDPFLQKTFQPPGDARPRHRWDS